MMIGAVLIAVGAYVSMVSGSMLTSGPLSMWNETRGIAQLGAITAGIGVLMLIISFGLRRRRNKGGGYDSLQKSNIK